MNAKFLSTLLSMPVFKNVLFSPRKLFLKGQPSFFALTKPVVERLVQTLYQQIIEGKLMDCSPSTENVKDLFHTSQMVEHCPHNVHPKGCNRYNARQARQKNIYSQVQ